MLFGARSWGSWGWCGMRDSKRSGCEVLEGHKGREVWILEGAAVRGCTYAEKGHRVFQGLALEGGVASSYHK